MVETEGMLNTRTGEYDFIGRSIPIFPQNDLDVPVGEKAYVTSTVFESKDEPTQMTKQSFTIIYFITYKKTIHFKLICKNVHS